ncbi:MAG: DUF1254 domain-containing protein [Proteobacteria bacterium]|nr:DUF1254 domain-containing protein [Pseudomonadota bacterium]
MPMMPGWMKGLSWYTAVLALVSGGIIHIVATLVVPEFARASAFQRLSQSLPINRMRVLPPIDAASQPLPYLGPDVRLAVCRYDVSDGPVAITAALPDKGWTLGLYTKAGDNFYVLPAQETKSGELTMTLIPPGERSFSLLTLGGRTAITSVSQVEVPESTGFAVIRAPVRGRAFAGEIEATLKRAGCAVRRS